MLSVHVCERAHLSWGVCKHKCGGTEADESPRFGCMCTCIQESGHMCRYIHKHTCVHEFENVGVSMCVSTQGPSYVNEYVNLCTLCRVWAHSEFMNDFICACGFECVM